LKPATSTPWPQEPSIFCILSQINLSTTSILFLDDPL
jgi:hypothetical protein